MSKIVLGNLIRHLITLLIGFFVARQMLSADVAAKLNAGDTVELWGGAWTVSIKQVADFVTLSIVPVLAPVLWGAWVRVRDKYKIWVARISDRAMSAAEVKEAVATTSTTDIIKTVATSQHT